MEKFKQSFFKYDGVAWLASVIMALLSWLANRLVRLPHIRRSQMVTLSWLLLNGAFAIWVGRHIKRNGSPWWELFIFPVCYLIVAYLTMPPYSWYLAPAYLGVSYLSWALTSADKPRSPWVGEHDRKRVR